MLDAINGLFEVGLSLMLLLNLRRIRKDKKVEGFDWRVIGFTTMWGVWNLFYYPSLNQMFSFYAGIAVVAVNIAWLAHVWYYHTRSGITGAQWRKMYSPHEPGYYYKLQKKGGDALEEYVKVDAPLIDPAKVGLINPEPGSITIYKEK